MMKQPTLLIFIMTLGLLVTSAFAPIADSGTTGLTDTEAAGLLYMREEEKLAHDVYTKLYELWGQPVFANIARSESAHTEAVKQLLERYGLADPVSGLAAGEFQNADLQTLYDDLVAQGSRSLGDALLVGGAIEEIDILDLQDELSQTDKADIQRVYQNLLAGSQNHLRAFSRNSERQTGESYQPQYMSADAYQQVMSASSGQGNGGGSGQGRGNGQARGAGNGYGRGNNLDVDV